MEVSALKYSGRGGLYGRSPLLRLQSDERLVAVIRRGNTAAFELLVSRYETRLLSFCRHLLRSREDAEDVLQEVLTAAYNAMLSDDRPINVRPWLYRIARNRCLNHLRKAQAVGVDSMDVHFSDNGASTADKVNDREEFRQLVGDIHGLPETQRTALVLREMDALSYEQIAEAMDTTVPSVKSLLVRARVSLAEASEARLLTCEEVREELGEAAEGLIKKPSAAVRRHVKSCGRCERFEKEIRHSRKAVAAALVPVGAIGIFRKLLLIHLLGHSAGSGAAGAGAAGASATGTGAVAGASAAGAGAAGAAGAGAAGAAAGGAGSAGLISAGVGAVATKAAAGLAAAALVTAGTVAVSHDARHHVHQPTGLQVLTQSVNAGVARSDASAPRLAAPVQAPRVAKPVKTTRAHSTRTVNSRSLKSAPITHNRSAAAFSAKAANASPTPTTSVTAVTSSTPTATAASVGTPTLVTTTPAATTTATTTSATTPTATTTTATTATTTTTTSTTATTTTTTPTETTTTPTATTPTETTTTPSSPSTGGQGIIPSSPVTTVASAVTSPPSS
jgi:RNA polymerase sigma factor (sigma-70 family)